jgi:hypothetical protein
MAGNKHRKRAQRKGDIGRFIGSVDVYMILFVDSLEKKKYFVSCFAHRAESKRRNIKKFK